ncbi:2-oxoglutarate synthase subunit alpha [candidate division WOR-3 bacterium RBG_13_43_14]|uniref:2-oxoglutarate synthase subunit alpha n=1 Tax=candidate division WOR-3 bacterium RBG_13_43_14 TaxID=1802590 RepID=A0A1F4U1M7_UNCW3|nr:MAG: 2-oxoglutarate synthase subunit alpha [candidate division WOR-3 bacterium RBG_13_43_14]
MNRNQLNIRLMSGNEACAEAALIAGMRFFAGYPITPSTEIAEILSRRLPKVKGVFIQMEDEIASMASVIGASLAGVKSMTATSGPGFSLMQENIGFAIMAEIPCVVVNVQRGGPSTGLPTNPAQGDVMQARWGTHGDHPAIVVAPGTVNQVFEWTIKAFNLSEYYRIPVIMLLDEIVSHINEKVILPDPSSLAIINRKHTTKMPGEYIPYQNNANMVPEFIEFGLGYHYHVTGLSHDESGFPTNTPGIVNKLIRRLNDKIEKHRHQIIKLKTEFVDDADTFIIAYGSTARSAHFVARMNRAKGIKIGFIQPLVLWPFPGKEIADIVKNAKSIIVPEMNLGQLSHEIECACARPVISVNRVDGNMITPEDILERL